MRSDIVCDETAVIHSNVEFDGPAFIGPHCVIGGFGFQHSAWSVKDFADRPSSVTRIGSEARILGHSVICCGTTIGDRLRVDYHCLVGEDCQIGNDCVIEYGARIYDRVQIGMKSYISGFICNDVVIGENCVVSGSLIHARLKPGLESAPRIEDNCLVGTGSIIVGGITIRKGTIVAAGAVVRSDTEEGYIYVGAPARRGRKVQWF